MSSEQWWKAAWNMAAVIIGIFAAIEIKRVTDHHLYHEMALGIFLSISAMVAKLIGEYGRDWF